MKCYFVRHGEAAFNTLGLCNADPSVKNSLTRVGLRQAQEVANRLQSAALDRIFTSELPRAQETARIINRYHQAPIHIDARLNDRKSGFEGQPVSHYLAAVEHAPLHFKAAGGEAYLELKQRVCAFLAHLAGQQARQLLVVTHHEVLQVVNGYFKGLSEIDMWQTWIEHAQVLQFEL